MVSLLRPIDGTDPRKAFPPRPHPQPPVNCCVTGPVQTNNTFNNLLLHDQTCPIWPLPYSLWVARDGGLDHGVGFNHTERLQLVYGPRPDDNPVQFYFNAPKIKSFAFTGQGWTSVQVSMSACLKMAATIHVNGPNRNGGFSMPIAYGMGFVTAIYRGETPVIHSAVGVQRLESAGLVANNSVAKYRATLFDQRVWSVYVSGDAQNTLRLADPNHIVAARASAEVVIQLCKGDHTAYDDCAGRYPVECTISAEAAGSQGTYAFNYQLAGNSASGKSLVFALPHHDVDKKTQQAYANLRLDSPTKGVMTGYVTDTLTMTVANLPLAIGVEPWTSVPGFSYDPKNYTPAVKALIREAAAKDAADDVAANCNLDSMYFAGKQLDKYAYVAYVAHFVLRDHEILQVILPKIKAAIEKFARNQQQHRLVYDESWRGLVSDTPPDQDFGNANYNDHHFHFGYHVHAIALVASIDPSWLDANSGLVKSYALALVRDYANPLTDDFFPQYRNFDWYHGHSFAHGIFPSADGKDEESSSEDYHSIHAIRLLGSVLGNNDMQLSASLILGIMQNAFNRYMLYTDDNTDEPANFIGNKVSGILFENKIDFATYFGRGNVADEFIHGIHMIPITSISSYMRSSKFTAQEWRAKLAQIVDRVQDGWRGILMLNMGLFDPVTAWRWFARSDWQDSLIDGGMSRTWSLTYLAGIGGAK